MAMAAKKKAKKKTAAKKPGKAATPAGMRKVEELQARSNFLNSIQNF